MTKHHIDDIKTHLHATEKALDDLAFALADDPLEDLRRELDEANAALAAARDAALEEAASLMDTYVYAPSSNWEFSPKGAALCIRNLKGLK